MYVHEIANEYYHLVPKDIPLKFKRDKQEASVEPLQKQTSFRKRKKDITDSDQILDLDEKKKNRPIDVENEAELPEEILAISDSLRQELADENEILKTQLNSLDDQLRYETWEG